MGCCHCYLYSFRPLHPPRVGPAGVVSSPRSSDTVESDKRIVCKDGYIPVSRKLQLFRIADPDPFYSVGSESVKIHKSDDL